VSLIFGIDIGGSSIKMGLVDTSTGQVTDRNRIIIPDDTSPRNIIESIKPLIPNTASAIGFGVPSIVKNGKFLTAPRLDKSWKTTDVKHLAEDIIGLNCCFINDADAAALAEMKFGAIKFLRGVSVMITLGTGIGTAICLEDELLYNTEFGRMALPNGIDNVETIAAGVVKTNLNLSWAEYADRVNMLLNEINKFFWPDHVIIGGGVSDSWNDWGHLLNAPFKIHKAHLGNSAGTIGAAIYASL
jgi:polyphosphate glucokinase